jgi:hypothetical protein
MSDELRRELAEAGAPANEIGELVELAETIAERSRVRPNAAWLKASRERLLAEFDRQQATRAGASRESE